MFREMAIHTGSLYRDTEQLKALLRRLENDEGRLIEEVRELNQMWQGPSNQTFNAQFRSDCEAFDNLRRVIHEMIQAMEHAKKEYEVCDSRVNSLVRALKI